MDLKRRDFLAGMAALGSASLLPPEIAAAQEQVQPIADKTKYKYSKPIIDARTEWYAPSYVDQIEKEGAANGVTEIHRNELGELECTVPGSHPYAPRARFRREMMDVDIILKGMDDRDVNMYTLTQTNPHVLWATPSFGLELARVINNDTSALCAKYPTRFTGAITLPLQDVHASLYELERARKLPGMRAVEITENILGRNIGDKDFWPLYEAIEAANLPIFTDNIDPFSERMIENDYSMMNVLGNPFEATMAATSMVLSGAMDQFPNLDIFMIHAGGFFAFATPRMDWSMGTAAYFPQGRTKSFANLKLPRASDYRRRFHYDLILHDPNITRMLIDLVGVDRVTCGTGFPQGMGIMKPVEYVESIPNITQRECEIILCENPARLLRYSFAGG